MQALFALQRFTQMQYLSKVIFKIIERFLLEINVQLLLENKNGDPKIDH